MLKRHSFLPRRKKRANKSISVIISFGPRTAVLLIVIVKPTRSYRRTERRRGGMKKKEKKKDTRVEIIARDKRRAALT